MGRTLACHCVAISWCFSDCCFCSHQDAIEMHDAIASSWHRQLWWFLTTAFLSCSIPGGEALWRFFFSVVHWCLIVLWSHICWFSTSHFAKHMYASLCWYCCHHIKVVVGIQMNRSPLHWSNCFLWPRPDWPWGAMPCLLFCAWLNMQSLSCMYLCMWSLLWTRLCSLSLLCVWLQLSSCLLILSCRCLFFVPVKTCVHYCGSGCRPCGVVCFTVCLSSTNNCFL